MSILVNSLYELWRNSISDRKKQSRWVYSFLRVAGVLVIWYILSILQFNSVFIERKSHKTDIHLPDFVGLLAYTPPSEQEAWKSVKMKFNEILKKEYPKFQLIESESVDSLQEEVSNSDGKYPLAIEFNKISPLEFHFDIHACTSIFPTQTMEYTEYKKEQEKKLSHLCRTQLDSSKKRVESSCEELILYNKGLAWVLTRLFHSYSKAFPLQLWDPKLTSNLTILNPDSPNIEETPPAAVQSALNNAVFNFPSITQERFPQKKLVESNLKSSGVEDIIPAFLLLSILPLLLTAVKKIQRLWEDRTLLILKSLRLSGLSYIIGDILYRLIFTWSSVFLCFFIFFYLMKEQFPSNSAVHFITLLFCFFLAQTSFESSLGIIFHKSPQITTLYYIVSMLVSRIPTSEWINNALNNFHIIHLLLFSIFPLIPLHFVFKSYFSFSKEFSFPPQAVKLTALYYSLIFIIFFAFSTFFFYWPITGSIKSLFLNYYSNKEALATDEDNTLLQCSNLYKSYSQTADKKKAIYALKSVSLSLYPSQFIALIGHNGAGKSTLFNLLAGLDRPDKGEILYGSGCSQKHVSVCTQDNLFLSDMNLTEIIIYINGVTNSSFGGFVNFSKSRKKAEIALSEMDMVERGNESPELLSYGLQRRFSVALALLNEQQKIILLDEPTSGVDYTSRSVILEALKSHQEKRNLCVVLSSHHLDDALKDITSDLLLIHQGRNCLTCPIDYAFRFFMISNSLHFQLDKKKIGGASSAFKILSSLLNSHLRHFTLELLGTEDDLLCYHLQLYNAPHLSEDCIGERGNELPILEYHNQNRVLQDLLVGWRNNALLNDSTLSFSVSNGTLEHAHKLLLDFFSANWMSSQPSNIEPRESELLFRQHCDHASQGILFKRLKLATWFDDYCSKNYWDFINTLRGQYKTKEEKLRTNTAEENRSKFPSTLKQAISLAKLRVSQILLRKSQVMIELLFPLAMILVVQYIKSMSMGVSFEESLQVTLKSVRDITTPYTTYDHPSIPVILSISDLTDTKYVHFRDVLQKSSFLSQMDIRVINSMENNGDKTYIERNIISAESAMRSLLIENEIKYKAAVSVDISDLKDTRVKIWSSPYYPSTSFSLMLSLMTILCNGKQVPVLLYPSVHINSSIISSINNFLYLFSLIFSTLTLYYLRRVVSDNESGFKRFIVSNGVCDFAYNFSTNTITCIQLILSISFSAAILSYFFKIWPFSTLSSFLYFLLQGSLYAVSIFSFTFLISKRKKWAEESDKSLTMHLYYLLANSPVLLVQFLYFKNKKLIAIIFHSIASLFIPTYTLNGSLFFLMIGKVDDYPSKHLHFFFHPLFVSCISTLVHAVILNIVLLGDNENSTIEIKEKEKFQIIQGIREEKEARMEEMWRACSLCPHFLENYPLLVSSPSSTEMKLIMQRINTAFPSKGNGTSSVASITIRAFDSTWELFLSELGNMLKQDNRMYIVYYSYFRYILTYILHFSPLHLQFAQLKANLKDYLSPDYSLLDYFVHRPHCKQCEVFGNSAKSTEVNLMQYDCPKCTEQYFNDDNALWSSHNLHHSYSNSSNHASSSSVGVRIGAHETNKNKCVLNDVSFSIKKRKIYTLIGRNGSGKTTLLNIMTRRLVPTYGGAQIDSHASIVYMPQNISSLWRLNYAILCDFVLDIYTSGRVLYQMDNERGDIVSNSEGAKDRLLPATPINFESRYNRIIRQAQLYRLSDRDTKLSLDKLSQGTKKKIFAAALTLAGADLTIFDEASSGMDVCARETLVDSLCCEVQKGKTIISTTHCSTEASRYNGTVILMQNKNLIGQNDYHFIKNILISPWILTVKLLDQRKISCLVNRISLLYHDIISSIEWDTSKNTVKVSLIAEQRGEKSTITHQDEFKATIQCKEVNKQEELIKEELLDNRDENSPASAMRRRASVQEEEEIIEHLWKAGKEPFLMRREPKKEENTEKTDTLIIKIKLSCDCTECSKMNNNDITRWTSQVDFLTSLFTEMNTLSNDLNVSFSIHQNPYIVPP